MRSASGATGRISVAHDEAGRSKSGVSRHEWNCVRRSVGK